MFQYTVSRTWQPETPTNGATVVASPFDTNDISIWMAPSSNLATLTVQLPADADTIIGQEVAIGCSKAVAALTLTGPANILNAPNLLQANDSFTMRKVAQGTGVDTWAKKDTV